jgi:Ca2+:H+ antiporter
MSPPHSLLALLRREKFLAVSIASALAFLLAGDSLLADLAQPTRLALVFLWLFAATLGSALAVVRHADHLAHRLGEPYGTLILTLAVTAIEAASITAVMMHNPDRPALVRDTLFAVIMLLLNGAVGVSLLLGGWRHREQSYNLQGANAYLGVIIPLAMLSLIVPDYTQTTPGPLLSRAQEWVLSLIMVGLYAAFLVIQTGRHRGFFTLENGTGQADELPAAAHASPAYHSVLLIC